MDAHTGCLAQPIERGKRRGGVLRLKSRGHQDPRVQIQPGRTSTLVVTKVAAFFMEQITGKGEVQGHFLKARANGTFCPNPPQGAFAVGLKLVE